MNDNKVMNMAADNIRIVQMHLQIYEYFLILRAFLRLFWEDVTICKENETSRYAVSPDNP